MKKLTTLLLLIITTIYSYALPVNVMAAAPGSEVFGELEAPEAVRNWNVTATGSESGIGLIGFFSAMIRLITVVAGIWSMFNFITAGWTYLNSSGDSSVHTKVSGQLMNTFIGLALIVMSYTIAAILGIILFGDATFIINPKFQGV
jgi:hypothetical protein